MIDPLVPLTYYCLLILAASILGGMIPQWVQLTHRGMQLAVSFVAGVMLGVGLLDMVPHALAQAGPDRAETVALWALAGLLTMFFIERFFCFHHHDVESTPDGTLHEHDDHPNCQQHAHHGHDLTWSGAALGLTLHSVIAGVALAASVNHAHGPLAGLGTFLVILLHKPFDSMTITMLMERGSWTRTAQYIVNGLFALAIPLGAAVFQLGLIGNTENSMVLSYALAFSAGTFLCISMSDLLPELQFHDHDRVKLSAALLLGLALAFGVGKLEHQVHNHDREAAGAALPCPPVLRLPAPNQASLGTRPGQASDSNRARPRADSGDYHSSFS